MAQTTLMTYFSRAPPQPPHIQATTLSTSPKAPEEPPSHSTPTSELNKPLENNPHRSHNPSTTSATPSNITPISQARITPISPSHLDALRQLTTTILPVRYSDKFYNTILSDPVTSDLCRAILYLDKPIGWIRCRLEPATGQSQRNQIYIQALCVLAPYRERGFASLLLREVIAVENLRKYRVDSVYAHVWERNEEALEWYCRRGFKKGLMEEAYYTKLRPAGAWVVMREIGVQDFLPEAVH